MKKYMSFALALLLAATVLSACGETVSKDPEGLITDPTGPSATVNPMPTMTIPATEPSGFSDPMPSSDPTQPHPSAPSLPER